jgi:hypothetical protein
MAKTEYKLKINTMGNLAILVTSVISTFSTAATYNYHTFLLLFSKTELRQTV